MDIAVEPVRTWWPQSEYGGGPSGSDYDIGHGRGNCGAGRGRDDRRRSGAPVLELTMERARGRR